MPISLVRSLFKASVSLLIIIVYSFHINKICFNKLARTPPTKQTICISLILDNRYFYLCAIAAFLALWMTKEPLLLLLLLQEINIYSKHMYFLILNQRGQNSVLHLCCWHNLNMLWGNSTLCWHSQETIQSLFKGWNLDTAFPYFILIFRMKPP